MDAASLALEFLHASHLKLLCIRGRAILSIQCNLWLILMKSRTEAAGGVTVW
jgi:hypothetical protein